MTDFSIIIPSYNTKDITLQTIQSVKKHLDNVSAEIIVVDNASTDGSREMLAEQNVTAILLDENVGFSKANNIALKQAQGTYILYLNSDMIIDDVDFNALKHYLDTHPKIGALTVTVNLTPTSIDPASHRGFPTVWRSFCYYAGLEKTLGKLPLLSYLFGGYHLTHLSLDSVHEIDSPTGAFFLTRKSLMEELGGFDEQFFMYGEDLDLAYRIKEKGYTIIYYPKYHVTHLKYQSGMQTKNTQVKKKISHHFYDAMKIFYRKHYENKYPAFINTLVFKVIDFKAKSA